MRSDHRRVRLGPDVSGNTINISVRKQQIAAVLDFQGARQLLRTHLRYDGVFDRPPTTTRPIPYTLTGDFDYTRATVVAHSIALKSGTSEIRLQGKIDHVLSHDISSKLAYKGNVDVPFLNYFFPREKFGGTSGVAGFLEFAAAYFSTQGNAAAKFVDFNGWRALGLRQKRFIAWVAGSCDIALCADPPLAR